MLLVGCAGYQQSKKESALNSTLSSYQTAMRWGHWETLVSYRGAKAPAVPEFDFDNIRVTSYEIRQPPVSTDENTAHQVVQIGYVLNDQQRLRKLYDRQEWRYDPEAKQWRVFSPFPDFR
jgi:hypothetical protein